MKQIILGSLRSVQRPVAVMLTLIPLGSLVVTFYLVRWSQMMTAHGTMDPNIAGVVTGFGTLFREFAMPILVLTVALAVLNVVSAFAARVQRPEVS
jgi:hypothetical protein